MFIGGCRTIYDEPLDHGLEGWKVNNMTYSNGAYGLEYEVIFDWDRSTNQLCVEFSFFKLPNSYVNKVFPHRDNKIIYSDDWFKMTGEDVENDEVLVWVEYKKTISQHIAVSFFSHLEHVLNRDTTQFDADIEEVNP
jgi:hypothetical protein